MLAALMLCPALLGLNCVVHRLRRGRWDWTIEEGFKHLN
jgi:hypothetical protein